MGDYSSFIVRSCTLVSSATNIIQSLICNWSGPEKGRFDMECHGLPAKAVQRAALTLQCVHDVHGCDGLALGVLRVRDGVANNVLKEDLEDAPRFFVDQTGDALHSATTSETTDRRLGYALDVVTEHLAMTLGASLAESLSSFASS